MDILEEYRGQSDQTICIVGTIILSTKICMVDGKFSLYEKDEILKTFPTKDPKKKEVINDIIDKASKDKNDITYHAERIKRYIDPKHGKFLDFIVATLIKFAKADHHFDVKEKRLINKVVDIFNDHKEPSMFEKFKNNKIFRKWKKI